jgi:hypothetical protein
MPTIKELKAYAQTNDWSGIDLTDPKAVNAYQATIDRNHSECEQLIEMARNLKDWQKFEVLKQPCEDLALLFRKATIVQAKSALPFLKSFWRMMSGSDDQPLPNLTRVGMAKDKLTEGNETMTNKLKYGFTCKASNKFRSVELHTNASDMNEAKFKFEKFLANSWTEEFEDFGRYSPEEIPAEDRNATFDDFFYRINDLYSTFAGKSDDVIVVDSCGGRN